MVFGVDIGGGTNTQYYFMMKDIFKTTLKSLGFSIATIFTMNLLIFIVQFNEYNVTQDWDFNLEQGTFLINNIPTGFEFGRVETKGLLLLLFIVGIFMKFKTQNTPLQSLHVLNKNASD